LRKLLLTLLVLLLPLQSLAAVMPVLSINTHAQPVHTVQSTASVPSIHCHTHEANLIHEDIVKATEPCHHHGLSGHDCGCAWCLACLLPAASPALTPTANPRLQPSPAVQISFFIPDQPQRPPR